MRLIKNSPLCLVSGAKWPEDHAAQMDVAGGFYAAGNMEQYLTVLEKSIAAGNIEAMAAMAAYLAFESSDEWISDEDADRVVALTRRAAAENSAYGQYVMGLLLLAGEFVEQDLDLAAKYMHASHEGGWVGATFELAHICKDLGDIDGYREHLLDAVERGSPNAMFEAGFHYIEGVVLQQDKMLGYTLVASAAEAGCDWMGLLGNNFFD